MGDAGRDALRVGFDRTVKLEFHGATVSSDAGLLPYRDLDEAVQLTASAAAELLDLRTGRNIRHGMAASPTRRAAGPAAPGGGEDRVAPGRAVPPRRVHRDESASVGAAGGEVLQRQGHGRAVDQGGQERGAMDEAVVPRWLYAAILERVRRLAAAAPRAGPA
jgi:hypothetical protein